MSTREVIENHLDALRRGDIEAIMADYAEDAVLILPGQVFRGVTALREVFAGAVAGPFKPGAHTFDLAALEVDGEYGLITWSLTFEGGRTPFGTDTFHVLDGQIVAQTGASTGA